MTTLDKTIPYEELIMVYEGPDQNQVEIPEGYSIAPHALPYKDQWINLMCQVKLFDDSKAAADYWEKMEKSDKEALDQNFFMIVDEQNHLAATAGFWPGDHLKEKRMRIHFVAADENHQRKGLAKAAVLHAINLYNKTSTVPIYLSTQAQSWAAIAMYESIGFKPWLHATEKNSEVQVREAWKKAMELIRNRFE